MKNRVKGLIICGYPGIGKSSIAGWNNCIDLESSWFSYDEEGNKKYPDDTWCVDYCNLAMRLAAQGYTVLTSTHACVINELRDHKFELDYKYKVKVVIFVPRSDMKKAWVERLINRYLESDLDIDLRAFIGGIQYWDSKMVTIRHTDFPVYYPNSINYDFRDYILKIREKEGIMVDETSTKTNSSMESMAGVEETGMDVSVVEKSADTPEPIP